MLLILFRIGTGTYALDTSKITEVLPLIEIDPLPDAQPGVAGLLNYRGISVPVIDLSALAAHGSVRKLLSTRLLVLRAGEAPHSPLFALLVEGATETLRVDPGPLHAGAPVEDSGWFGPVTTHRGKLVRIVDVAGMLPGPLRVALGLEAKGSE
ncbi:MAG TPA: chemotaxis protein CheW [Gammaproteobacteria bacterium]|nr:chemotaxis protein CheW [Gammaproteobacteria bacterium]